MYLSFRVVRATVLALAVLLSVLPASAQDRMSATQRLAEFERHRELVAVSPFRGLPWQRLGPTNIGGRVTDIAVTEPRGRRTMSVRLVEVSGRRSMGV